MPRVCSRVLIECAGVTLESVMRIKAVKCDQNDYAAKFTFGVY